MTDTTMSCERLDAVLEDYLEGDLDPRTRALVERHAGECLRCAALVHGIQGIRADAAKLPELEPTRDLWDGISARIEAPVIPLAPHQRSRFEFTRNVRLGVAAAILVALTAGVTYRLTMQRAGLQPETTLAGQTTLESRVQSPESRGTSSDVRPPTSNLPSALAAPLPVGLNVPATVTYDRAITQLRGILDLRRDDLDPGTVAVVENSLATIDRAIADARAALAHDSASAFLIEQLNKSLEKKLGLLRTVALLPPRA